MTIRAISPVRGALDSALLQSVAGPRAVAGQSAPPGTSTSDRASSFTGFTSTSLKGLYNSLGQLLDVTAKGTPLGSSVSSSLSLGKRGAVLESAVQRIGTGDTAGGRAEAQRLVSQNNGDAAALRVIGQSYLAEGNYRQSERYFAQASALAPDSAALKSDVAVVRVLQRIDEEVLDDARKKLKDPVRRNDGLRELAHLAARNPNGVDTYLALADGYNAARKPQQMIGALQEAARVAGGDRIDQVIARAQELVTKHPNAGITHNVLGRALAKADRFDEAIAEFKTASGLDPYNMAYVEDLADAYIVRAESKLAGGSGLTAQSDIDAARAIDPSNAGLGAATARLAADRAGRAVASRQYNKALSELRKAAAGAPNDTQLKKSVAALYVRVGEHFKSEGGNSVALAAYEKAYELDPTSTVAKRNVGELSHGIGMTALNDGNYDRAIEYLDKAYSTYRPDANYGQDLANAYDVRSQQRLSLGKLDDAIEDLTAGITLDPTSSSLNVHLSTAMQQKLAG